MPQEGGSRHETGRSDADQSGSDTRYEHFSKLRQPRFSWMAFRMNYGRNQLATPMPPENRVITVARAARPTQGPPPSDATLFGVVRRRWLLLTTCGLLSLLAAGLVTWRFEMPKARSTARLRYVSLPPTLKGVYETPNPIEFSEMLQSLEHMSELAERRGLQIDPKKLRDHITINANRYSNIIELQLKWRDGKESIDILNELTQIAA